jgi:hypothetical protein
LSKSTQKLVTQIFTSGTLGQKHEQITLFMTGGHSMLYSGDVAWKMTIPSADQTHKGSADSMDSALVQIKNLLEQQLKTANPATKVSLAIDDGSDRKSGTFMSFFF